MKISLLVSNKMRKIAVFALLILVFPGRLLAITDGNLGLSPAYDTDGYPGSLRYELRPGDTFEDEVRVTKTGSQGTVVDIYAEDIIIDIHEKNGVKIPDRDDTGRQFISKWVISEKASVNVGAGKIENVKLNVAIPADAAKGEYVGMMFIHEYPKESDSIVYRGQQQGVATEAQLARRIGMKIRVKITDDPKMPKRTYIKLESSLSGIELIVLSIIILTLVGGILLFLKEKHRISYVK